MTVTAMPTRVALSAIDVGENVRELDETHFDALARSIALRGLISPLTVRLLAAASMRRYRAAQIVGDLQPRAHAAGADYAPSGRESELIARAFGQNVEPTWSPRRAAGKGLLVPP